MPGFLFEEAGFTAQLCTTPESLETACRLRYKAYRSVDGIPENETALATDQYDLQSNARTHLLWFEGKPVASIRSLIWADRYNWQPTTCMDAYRPHVAESLGLNTRLLESNRYVVEPGFNARKSITAQYLLFRIQTISCLYDNCQHVITAVRPKHKAFYKRLMGFEPISPQLPVEGFQFEAVLLSTPYESRALLARNASIAALHLEDYERYAHHLAQPTLAYAHGTTV